MISLTFFLMTAFFSGMSGAFGALFSRCKPIRILGWAIASALVGGSSYISLSLLWELVI